MTRVPPARQTATTVSSWELPQRGRSARLHQYEVELLLVVQVISESAAPCHSQNWERIRVEVQSLSLRPEGRLARDSGVVRLFVEFSLLDLPTEETPMSLPKPRPGRSINFNYSKGM